jgi:hypothetical protein
MRVIKHGVLAGFLLFVVLMSCSCVHRHSPNRDDLNAFCKNEDIYSCLNPKGNGAGRQLDNYDGVCMKEWKKIDDKLKAHGIVAPMSFASIGATFYTVWNKADDARKIITQMIRDGEVDADILQLKLIKEPTIDQATQAVARLWRDMPEKDADTILWEGIFESSGLHGMAGCSCGHYWFRFYPLSGGCILFIGVDGRWDDKESENALIKSAAIYQADGKRVMKINLKSKEDLSKEIGANARRSPSGDIQKVAPEK